MKRGMPARSGRSSLTRMTGGTLPPVTLARVAPAVAFAALALGAVIASAQQRGRSYDDVPWCYAPDECPRTPYDGRFTFVRVYFDARSGLGGFGRYRGGREPPWHHDRPYAERNLSSIMREVSLARTFDGMIGGNVFALDDPEIFRYPVLWLAEPGFWVPSDGEVDALRVYLLKGGFMIFDDFDGRAMYNLVAQMQRVLPDLQPIRMTGDEPIFRSFFDVELASLSFNQNDRGPAPDYWGLFEDNDPTKRQLVIMNNNNDIGEFMEYSATGFYPVDLANDAYKLGVNYMVYALTH
jgi:hypothetical protein